MRVLLVGLLLLCVHLGNRHWRRNVVLFSSCLEMPQRCVGQRFDSDRWLRVVDREGDHWTLEVERRLFRTTSRLEAAERGDLLEARLTLLDVDRVEIHSFVILRPRHTQIRIGLSLVASVVVVLLLLRRRLRAPTPGRRDA